MFGLGLVELAVILVVVLVLFGAGKLPGVMGEVGRGLSMFKKGLADEEAASTQKVAAKKAPAKKAATKKTASKKASTKKAPAKRKSS